MAGSGSMPPAGTDSLPSAARGPVSILTGATGAIGGAVARRLAARSGTLVLACRDARRGEALRASLHGPAATEVLPCDLSDPASVRAAVDAFLRQHDSLNLLVNAAAVFVSKRERTASGRELMFATNHLGPFLLTNLLRPALIRGAPSRVITITAPATNEIDFDDLDATKKFSPFRAFGASKAANLLFTQGLARRVAGSGITAISVHPGVVKSGLMKNAPVLARLITGLFGRKPDASADAIVRLGTDASLQVVPGGFYKRDALSRAPRYTLNEQVQDRLWDVSAQLTGLA